MTVEDVTALRNACIENASELIEEARILAERSRWARAFELAYFAREELAKADLLAVTLHMLFADPDSVDWDRFRKRWEDHKSKSRDAIFTDFLAEEIFVLGKLAGVELEVQKEGDQAAALRKKREAALYVDVRNGVQKPSTTISEGDARSAIETAERQLGIAIEMGKEYAELTPERARELIEQARHIDKT